MYILSVLSSSLYAQRNLSSITFVVSSAEAVDILIGIQTKKHQKHLLVIRALTSLIFVGPESCAKKYINFRGLWGTNFDTSALVPLFRFRITTFCSRQVHLLL